MTELQLKLGLKHCNDNSSIDMLKEEKKYHLLSFNLEGEDFITIENEKLSKQEVIDLYDQIISEFDFYKKLHNDNQLKTFLLTGNIPSNYFFNHDEQFTTKVKEIVAEKLYLLAVDIFEDNVSKKSSSAHLEILNTNKQFPLEIQMEYGMLMSEYLLTYVDFMLNKYENISKPEFLMDQIFDDWNSKRHSFLINSNSSVLIAYHNWIIKITNLIIKYSSGKLIYTPENYFHFLKFIINYYYDINPDSVGHIKAEIRNIETQKNNLKNEGSTETGLSSWQIVMIILVILRIIAFIARS